MRPPLKINEFSISNADIIWQNAQRQSEALKLKGKR